MKYEVHAALVVVMVELNVIPTEDNGIHLDYIT